MIEVRKMASRAEYESAQRIRFCVSMALFFHVLSPVFAADHVWPTVQPLDVERTFQVA